MKGEPMIRIVTVSISLLLAASAVAVAEPGQDGATAARETVVLDGDVHVRAKTVWANGHYKIKGSLLLETGGELHATNCTIEIVNRYAREHSVAWNGGRLVTKTCVIGGTKQSSGIQHANLDVRNGEWIAEDTVVRYCYGIVVGERGRVRACRLTPGESPDSVIMTGKGDVELRDSTYAISLTADISQGGKHTFDLPTGVPVSATYDGSSIPGAGYRLRLDQVVVPGWFLFFGGVSNRGRPAEITLRRAPYLIPSIMAHNLTGAWHLPCGQRDAAGKMTTGVPAGTEIRVGNLTMRNGAQEAGITTWGLYLDGAKTDVEFDGRCRICECFLSGGHVTLRGTAGHRDLVTPATTIEVGDAAFDDARYAPRGKTASPARLTLRNATVGTAPGPVVGQVTAHEGGSVNLVDCDILGLTLITKGDGAIAAERVEKEGTVRKMQEGGPITGL